MPSPIGHSLMGYAFGRATIRPPLANHLKLIVLCVFAANAPDLDFLPGLFAGDLGRYHHGPSHSIVFAAVFGILAGALFPRRIYAFVMGFGLYLSHVLLDYLVQDPSPPLGVPLFWPFTGAYYMAPFAFYRPFNYPINFAEPMLSTVFSFHNFLTMMTETLILLPVLVFVSWYKRTTLRSDNVPISRCSGGAAEQSKNKE
jgi:inner membrane protein